MSVLVTGSVAIDHIMVFEDHFRNHFVGDKLEKLNVAFHVPAMSKQYGGTGANIAYNLKRLGLDPILLATVGSDLGAYADWLDRHGVRRDHLRVIDDEYTAAAFITTDLSNNQIISFHPGAMDRAHEARIAHGQKPSVDPHIERPLGAHRAELVADFARKIGQVELLPAKLTAGRLRKRENVVDESIHSPHGARQSIELRRGPGARRRELGSEQVRGRIHRGQGVSKVVRN